MSALFTSNVHPHGTSSDEPMVATPSERPSATILDFIGRVPSFLRRGQHPEPVGNHLTASRMADFNHWWDSQRLILREYGWTHDQISDHQTTAHLAWVTADALRANATECGSCSHGPHAGAGGGFLCTALYELDDGPHICGCDEDGSAK